MQVSDTIILFQLMQSEVVSLLTEDGRIREKVGFEKGELALWKRCK
jgi:hypothetical protein